MFLSTTVKPKIKKNSGSLLLKTEILIFIIYLLIFFFISILALISDLSEAYMFPLSVAAFSFASYLSGTFVGLKKREKGLINGVLFTLPVNFVLFFAALISVSFKPDLSIIISIIIFTFSSAVGGITGVNLKLKKKRR